jgi:hypothetical protein
VNGRAVSGRANVSPEVMRYHVALHARTCRADPDARHVDYFACPHGTVHLLCCACGDPLFIFTSAASTCGCEVVVT